MSLVDALASEYGWPLADILSLPVARALCLHAAILERHDVQTGTPSFAERDMLMAIRNPQSAIRNP